MPKIYIVQGEANIAEKLRNFTIFKYFHFPYRRISQYPRKSLGVWSFYYELIWVRDEWRHILKITFPKSTFSNFYLIVFDEVLTVGIFLLRKWQLAVKPIPAN